MGSDAFEEINVLTKPSENFGWPDSEGLCQGQCDGKTDPLIHWGRSSDHPFALDDDETSPTNRRVAWVGMEYDPSDGEDRYKGMLTGKMLYGDFCTGWVRAAELDDKHMLVSDAHVGHLVGVVSWATAADNYAYTVTYGSCLLFPYKPGKMYRAVLK